MKAPTSTLWPRLVFVLFASGLVFLGLQAADLWALRDLGADREGVVEAATLSARPVAYLPYSETTAASLMDRTLVPLDHNLAEVGDGGDLGQRVARLLDSYDPLLFGQARQDSIYVALAPMARLLGGELHWREGAPRGALLLSEALVTFSLGDYTAYRNYRPLALAAPPVGEYGQVRLPLEALGQLCGATVEALDPANHGLYRVSGPGGKVYVLVRERMYRLEACRSGRWLQVYFLGQPVKRYPICAGEGNNTPVGDFHIANKAVWPPWNAYWGEHMPGGSPRNPLGARWLGTTAHGRATGRVIGIHGTNQPSSIGQRISGGCMRCYNHHAIELYNNIPVGTPLTIHE